jgi:hypothetical protein
VRKPRYYSPFAPSFPGRGPDTITAKVMFDSPKVYTMFKTSRGLYDYHLIPPVEVSGSDLEILCKAHELYHRSVQVPARLYPAATLG